MICPTMPWLKYNMSAHFFSLTTGGICFNKYIKKFQIKIFHKSRKLRLFWFRHWFLLQLSHFRNFFCSGALSTLSSVHFAAVKIVLVLINSDWYDYMLQGSGLKDCILKIYICLWNEIFNYFHVKISNSWNHWALLSPQFLNHLSV